MTCDRPRIGGRSMKELVALLCAIAGSLALQAFGLVGRDGPAPQLAPDSDPSPARAGSAAGTPVPAPRRPEPSRPAPALENELAVAPPPPEKPWELTEETVFPGGNPAPGVPLLLALLSAPPEPGFAPVSAARLRALLSDSRGGLVYRDELIRREVPPTPKPPPATPPPSSEEILLRPENVSLGVRYLETHSRELDAARERHGVAPRDVVAVLMWQTKLGTATQAANFRLFNVLLGKILYLEKADAIAHGGPAATADEAERRSRRNQRSIQTATRHLADFLRWCEFTGTDPLSIDGWWAGMLGYAHFMPPSLRWAEDGDADGTIELYEHADAIASVASYLDGHGYRDDRLKALSAYNPSADWVAGVDHYARTIVPDPAEPDPTAVPGKPDAQEAAVPAEAAKE